MAEHSSKPGQHGSGLRKQLREAQKALKQAQSELEEAKKPKRLGIRGWWNESIEPNKPRWTYLLTPLLGCFAPLAALVGVGAAFWYNAQQISLSNKHEVFLTEQELKRENLEKDAAGKKNKEQIALVKGAERQRAIEQERFLLQMKQDRAKSEATISQQQATLLQQAQQFQYQQTLERSRLEASQNNFNTQLQTNDFQFKIDQSEKQFKDIQDRLASADEKTRATAALQLAELATIPYAQKPEKNAMKGPLAFRQQYYPFFPRTAQQFAIALTIEERASVRAAIHEGVKVMAKFAKDRDSGQDVLLVDMVNKLADANRAAQTKFITAMAHWSTVEADTKQNVNADTLMPAQIVFLAGVTRFCRKNEDTQSSLKKLIAKGQNSAIDSPSFYTQERRAYDAARRKEMEADAKKRVEADTQLLPALRVAAKQLSDTRDVLVTALTALSPPADFPTDKLAETRVEIDKAIAMARAATNADARGEALLKLKIATHALFWHEDPLTKLQKSSWHRKYALTLSECFLAGKKLRRAALAGAELDHAMLTGADLTEATLSGANLEYATLTKADIGYATLIGVELRDATLVEAYLRNITLTGANLRDADLTDSMFEDATLTGADFTYATLTGTYFRSATLTGTDFVDTTLTGTHFEYAKLFAANLTNATLTEAYLRDADLTGADLRNAKLTGAHVSGSRLDKAWVIPPTWDQADYKDVFGKEDTELKQKVASVYKKQVRQTLKN